MVYMGIVLISGRIDVCVIGYCFPADEVRLRMFSKMIIVCNFLVLMLLPSCVKYYELVPSETSQGEKIKG